MFARTLIQLQAELPALSSNSLHHTLEGAMHEIVPAGRGHALVVGVVRHALEAARTGARWQN